VPARAKEFRYAVDLAEGGELRTEDGTPLGGDPAWTPEHLVLAGLIRCSVESLRYHARRAGVEVAAAKGAARAMVTSRESDGRYAVVEAGVDLEVRLVPHPGEDERAELLAKAERDCFVGASLTVKPDYRWTVR
jgi:uncharacterized OsmC-like protein